MKKVIVILMGLMLSVNAMAMYESGTAMFSFQGGVGFGFNTGNIDENYSDAQTGVTYPYSVGTQFGYFFSDGFALTFGFAYTKAPISMVFKDNTDTGFRIDATFLDFSLGFRGYSDTVFFGAGLTYGKKTGDWPMYQMNDGKDTKLGDLSDGVTNDNIALFFELGMAIPLAETVTFDLGAKFNIGFSDIFDGDGTANFDGDKWRTSSLLVTGGLSFLF